MPPQLEKRKQQADARPRNNIYCTAAAARNKKKIASRARSTTTAPTIVPLALSISQNTQFYFPCHNVLAILQRLDIQPRTIHTALSILGRALVEELYSWTPKGTKHHRGYFLWATEGAYCAPQRVLIVDHRGYFLLATRGPCCGPQRVLVGHRGYMLRTTESTYCGQ